MSWDYSTVSVQKTLRSFDDTVGKIESYRFSNKGVKMCKATLGSKCILVDFNGFASSKFTPFQGIRKPKIHTFSSYSRKEAA